MSKFEKFLKLIDTVGNQWPLLIVIAVLLIIIIKWKTIWKALGNIKKVTVKRGDTVVELASKNENNSTRVTKEKQKVQEENEKIIDEKGKENTLYDCYLKISNGDLKGAQEAFENIQQNSNQEKKFENEIVFLYYEFLNGLINTEVLSDKLKKDNLGDEDKYLIYYYLGLCFSESNINNKAISSFYDAIKCSKDESQITRCIIHISKITFKSENIDSAIDILTKQLKIVELDNSKVILLKEIGNIYYETKNYTQQIAFLEMALEFAINDTSLLFDLAYAYSQTSFNNASIFHYLNLLNFRPKHSLALNNIGVGFKEQKMPMYAVNYYKRAIENGNSLAAGNLSYIYIDSGFEKEANELIDIL